MSFSFRETFESNIKYIAIGFRNSKYWGAGVGLVPFSSRGYTVSADYPAVGDLNEYRLISSGSGNINRLYFANSFKITNQLSVGATVSYLFGLLQNDEEINYSVEAYTDVVNSTSNYFYIFYVDFGLQYKFVIGPNEYFTGLTYNPLQKLKTSYERLVLDNTDTLTYETIGTEDFSIPASIGIGAGVNFKKQLKLMVDYKYAFWSQSDYHYKSIKLNDSWQINTGLEYYRGFLYGRNYWDYVYYRLGFRYEKSYLAINQHNINEMAITAGIGIPSKKDRTTLNISYEFAIRGTLADGLIRENFNRITLGIALKDKWFQKRKFY
jgi:hypothetical protein